MAAEVQEELLPMQGPSLAFRNLLVRRQSVRVTRHKKGLKGPLRAARLCILSVLFPGLLVAVPLYMRFHVYGEQLYPVGMSDMRLLDSRVSTTWCQVRLTLGREAQANYARRQPRIFIISHLSFFMFFCLLSSARINIFRV